MRGCACHTTELRARVGGGAGEDFGRGGLENRAGTSVGGRRGGTRAVCVNNGTAAVNCALGWACWKAAW